jgi:predicted transcriptional regulator
MEINGNTEIAKSEFQTQQIITDIDIMSTAYQPPCWIVPGLLPEGLTVLAGKPKIGKSMLSLNLSVSISTGGIALGQVSVEQKDVLYLALEDTPRRIQDRISTILHGSSPSGRLNFAFAWPKMDGTGLEELDRWLVEHPDAGLVVIDTLARIRGPKRNGSTLYDADYDDLCRIKSIADQHHITIVLLHHLRKAGADDILDLVSGSTGLTAAADTVAVLKRERARADAILYITGRDVEDKELALRFDNSSASFVLLGDAEEYRISKERREILEQLRSNGGPAKLKDIAAALNKQPNNVHKLLRGLSEQGLVDQPDYGQYCLASRSGESGESGEKPQLLN